MLQVDWGSWAENTEYVVAAAISPKAIGKIAIKKSITFKTGAPPKSGLVLVLPSEYLPGTPLTVSISDWVT